MKIPHLKHKRQQSTGKLGKRVREREREKEGEEGVRSKREGGSEIKSFRMAELNFHYRNLLLCSI